MNYQAEAGRADSLDFLRSMLVQLHSMAQSQDFSMVAYLIEMAYLETEDVLATVLSSKVRENN